MIAAMRALCVETPRVVGLEPGVRRNVSAGRACAMQRTRRQVVTHARVGWTKNSEGATSCSVRSCSQNTSLKLKKRNTHTTNTQNALGGSFDETDPETVLAEESAGDMKEVAAWVGAATLFGLGIGATMGAEKAEEYFSGYLLEQSLSVDNLFVFVLVFEYFKVPMKQQQKVLGYGIGGAMVMRAMMIVAGYEAVTNFKPVLLVFAGILIFSSYKLITEEEEEEENMSDNAIVKFCSGLLPVSEEYDGDNFFTEIEDDKTGEMIKTATPLLLCLCVIELSDVVFAVDSIPAVFGVTQDPFIVYSSNIFAILGLRSLYAFVAQMVAELEYLQTAVAAVLGFVGCKMVAEFGGVEISTTASLAVVVGMLGAGVTLSLVKKNGEEGEGEK